HILHGLTSLAVKSQNRMTPTLLYFFFSSRRRHTISLRDWSSDVCSSDLAETRPLASGWRGRCHAPSGPTAAGDYDARASTHNHRSEERRVGKERESRGGAAKRVTDKRVAGGHGRWR